MSDKQTKNSEIEPLAPCPFCGCSDIEFGIDVGACHPLSLPENEEQKYYYCQCKKCRCHYGYGTKEKCIKSWNTRPTPLAVVNGKDVEELASILENNPYDAIGLDSKQWAKIIIDAGYSKCQERPGLRVEFPEKKDEPTEPELSKHYVWGWNSAIDKFKELNSLKSHQGLKPLSESELIKLADSYLPWDRYGYIKLICSKFGSTVPNGGLSVEELVEIIQDIQLYDSDDLKVYLSDESEVDIAKSLLSALENKR